MTTTQHDPRPSLDELGRAALVAGLDRADAVADPPTTPELPYVQCPCGFRACGDNQEENRLAFQVHDCKWHEVEMLARTDRATTWPQSFATTVMALGFFGAATEIVYLFTH